MNDERPDEQTGDGAHGVTRPTDVETDGLRAAREGLARTAKDAGVVLKELAFKALELEQAALFNEPEFEPAFFLPPEDVKKKYTAAQANQITWRRNLCVYLLSKDTPIQDIQKLLEMNFRTVQAIAAQNGRALQCFTEAHANELAASAMSDIALADTKKHEASYKDLHIGAGIKLTHAVALKMTTAGVDVNDGAIDVQTEDPARVAFVARLKQLAPAKTVETGLTGDTGLKTGETKP